MLEQTVTTLQYPLRIFELVSDSIMTRSMEGIINFWNHSAEKLYGWKEEEAVGKVSHDLLKTQFPKPLDEIESELVRNGRWEGKLVHTTREGRRVVVESRWSVELEGQIGGLIEINARSNNSGRHAKRTLGKNKKPQSLRHQSVTMLQHPEYLFELVNDSVMTRGIEGRINFWNQSAEELYGWRREEAIGRVSHDLLQTQFPKPLEEIESELVRNGRWEGKLVHTTREGRRVVVESRWSLELEGQIGGLIEINARSNNSGRHARGTLGKKKKPQSSRHQSVTMLQHPQYLFELVNDSVMTRSIEGRINFWNHSAEELYGWSREEAIGKVSHDLLQTQFPKPLEEIESELVRNGRWEGKLVHTTRVGDRVVVESRWTLELTGQLGALVEINTRSTDLGA